MFGEEAVRFARAAVESEVRGASAPDRPANPRFSEMAGAFVTISEYPSHDLRGCIGYPYPVLPLADALEQAARSACHDPRFPDLTEGELGGVTVEVTVLGVPHEIRVDSPGMYPDSIVIGRDGLIIELMGRRGLLLPQVPVEWGWDAMEYLAHLSMKAGLPPDAWTHPAARISAFTGEIYREDFPHGEVVRGE